MLTPRAPRYSISFQIIYDDREGYMSGRVVDISETGMFIETVMPLKPGTRVRLSPLLDDSHDTGIFELEGEVVRKNEYDMDRYFDRTPGMGVRFINVSEEDLEQIRELLSVSGVEGKA